jgi:CO/xanthine dehydrogenase FAD-binding subunit
MAETTYYSPASVQEAILLLLKYGDKSRIIAGGSDVLVPPENRVSLARYMISLEGIRDLDYIRYDKSEGLKIGALATLDSLVKSALIKAKYAILAQAAGVLGTPALRNRATIGGNLCNAAPSADIAPPLIVLGAKVKIDSVLRIGKSVL